MRHFITFWACCLILAIPVSKAQVCNNFNNTIQGTSLIWDEFYVSQLYISDEEPTADGTPYLYARDAALPSFFYNDQFFSSSLSCGTICFDYKVFDDGVHGESEEIHPRLMLYKGGAINSPAIRAKWEPTSVVTENSDWQNFCASFQYNEIPPGWTITNGSNDLATWQELLDDVSGIGFTTDVGTGNQTQEKVGIDNLCYQQENEPNPISNFTIQDADGNETYVFCDEEEVFIDGSASINETEYLIALTDVTDDITTGFLFNTGFVPGEIGLVNISQLMVDNGFPPILGHTYRIRVHLQNNCGDSSSSFAEFIYSEGNMAGFDPPEICMVDGVLEATVTALHDNSNNEWEVYLVADDEPCSIEDPLPGIIIASSGDMGSIASWTFNLPNNPGQCYIVRHITSGSGCPDDEARDIFKIPEIPIYNPDFNRNYIGDNILGFANFLYTPLQTGYVIHSWSASVSNSLAGPWNVWPLSGAQPNGEFFVSHNYSYYYRVCHRVKNGPFEIFCSESTTCHYYEPVNNGEAVNVYDDNFNWIETIQLTDDTKDVSDGRDEQQMTDTRSRIQQLDRDPIVFPNPVQDMLNIQLHQQYDGHIEIQIIDALGKIRDFRSFDNPDSVIQMPTEQLNSGIYYLQIRVKETNEIFNQKIMVNKG